MIECFIGLGANKGECLAVIKKVLQDLTSTPTIFDLKSSPLYKTSPISPYPQNDYLNAVARFKTPLSHGALFPLLEEIEIKNGKKKKEKQAPREIDIDLIFYGALHYASESYTIPHPRWQERLFVLYPLLDLIERSPLDGQSIASLIHDLRGSGQRVELYGESL